MSILSFCNQGKTGKRFLLFLIALIFTSVGVSANQDKKLVLENSQKTTGRVDRSVRPVKNIILLIPDGCSLAVLSTARWYQWLLDQNRPSLFIDPFICGTVRTSSSDAPIGDSAPTTSCYMTGELSRTGHVSTYPESSKDADIFTMDPDRAYQPLMTILEASKVVKKKATGLVFTCEFPHATPADCSSHDYNRGNSTNISAQMVYNQLDFVAGGGVSFLSPDLKRFLTDKGYTVQINDVRSFRAFNGRKLWSLFGQKDMQYDMDRNPNEQPSLAEMTNKAIKTLSKNDNGFFLMVEGSKVDWAAHANDPTGMVTEFLAFDEACKVALDYARTNKNTAVIVVPDHGNSGISIGTSRMGGYDRLSANQIFSGLFNYKMSAAELGQRVNAVPLMQGLDTIFKYTSLRLKPEEVALLNQASDYKFSPIPAQARRTSLSLHYTLGKILSQHTGIGFTTNGHTGEEVFLAVYHPNEDILNGVRFNFEVNDYMCSLFEMKDQLPALTNTYFAKHDQVFKGCQMSILDVPSKKVKQLTVKKGNNELVVTQNSSQAVVNGQTKQLSTVVVFVDKNQTFYLPADLAKLLN